MHSVPVSPTHHTESVSASRSTGDGRAYISPIWLGFVSSLGADTLSEHTVTTLPRTLSRVAHTVKAGYLGPRRPPRRRVDRSGMAVHLLPFVCAARARGSMTCVAGQETAEPLLTATPSRAYLSLNLRQPLPGRVQHLWDRGTRAASFREPHFYIHREVRSPKRQEVACPATRHRDSWQFHAGRPWSVSEKPALLRPVHVLELGIVVPSGKIDTDPCDVVTDSAAPLTDRCGSAIRLTCTRCSHSYGPDSAGWE